MKWSTLRHDGVAFPPPYDPKGADISIKGNRLNLTPDQEEMAHAWAKKKDTAYVQDKTFAENFLQDFKKLLPPEYTNIAIEDIDFFEINKLIEDEKARKNDPVERKRLSAERKKIREALKQQYGNAEVDGEQTEIANWMVEPPGLFIGRGAHPLRGRWKPRTSIEDVTLNLGEDAPIPPGNWRAIVNDHNSMWLATWVAKLTQENKYVWLSDESSLRQSRDRAKLDNGIHLGKRIEAVRNYITKGLSSKDEKIRKLATVALLIDRLGMRVGDEKDKDEADTVGASTLRVEHVKLNHNTVDFDFLGKDSVRWQKSLALNGEDLQVVNNFQEFLKGKKEGDPIFDGISSSSVNRFLGRAMESLTAKVFRTYRATNTVRQYLGSHDKFPETASEFRKLFEAKMANLEAAIECNHKRTPPKNWENSLLNKEEKLRKLQLSTPKSENAKIRLKERVLKAELQIELARKTKDYNLGTSLRNYIDPRVYKAWADHVDFDWRMIYTMSLQRKMAWASRGRLKWPLEGLIA